MGDESPRGERGAGGGGRAAARRLGVPPKAVRDRIKHGSLQARPKGNLGREVLLPPGVATRKNDGELPGEAAVALPGENVGEIAELLEEMGELRHALGRAEGELAAKDALVAELRARAERAEVE